MIHLQFDKISEKDINQIMDVERASFSRPWNRDAFSSELLCRHASIIIAKHKWNGNQPNIIAYLCSRIFESELHILKVAVSRTWRRKGIASRMLDHYLNEASGQQIKKAFLEVRCSNIPAIALYKKRGFKSIGKRPDYYSNSDGNEDAILMMKYLKEAI